MINEPYNFGLICVYYKAISTNMYENNALWAQRQHKKCWESTFSRARKLTF